jgi:hypothetical protein
MNLGKSLEGLLPFAVWWYVRGSILVMFSRLWLRYSEVLGVNSNLAVKGYPCLLG